MADQTNGNERDDRLEVLEEISRSNTADRAYLRACQHWKTCYVCDTAGGEVAARNLLCPTGRMLRDTWEEAEKAYQELVGNPERDYLEEAMAIAAGRSILQPEKRHLEVLILAYAKLLTKSQRALRLWRELVNQFQETVSEGLSGAMPEPSKQTEGASPTLPTERSEHTEQDIAPQTSKEVQS